MASDLMTVAEWMTATGRTTADTDAAITARAQWGISVASELIRQYVDRDFTLTSDAVQGPRTFRYYGNGRVEIDDCTQINSVSTAITPWSPAARTLTAAEYIAGASSANLPVFDYLELWTNLPVAQSPAMGFTWNADTFAAQYGTRALPLEITVDGVWGWPAIPMQVKQAVVWTTGEVMADDSPYTTESISGYSHSYRDTRGSSTSSGGGGAPTPTAGSSALPPRAQAALDPYIRINV